MEFSDSSQVRHSQEEDFDPIDTLFEKVFEMRRKKKNTIY